jgi:hypothetical protein
MKTITRYGALLVALSLFSWNEVNAAAADRGPSALAAGRIKSKIQADIKALQNNPDMDLGQQFLHLQSILKNARSLKPPKKMPLVFNGYTKKGWATLRGQLLDEAGIDINGPIKTDEFVKHLKTLMLEITKVSDEGSRLDPDSIEEVATIVSNDDFPLMFSGKMYDQILDFITENFHIQIPVKNPKELAEALRSVNTLISFADKKPKLRSGISSATTFVDSYAKAMEAGLLYSAYKDIANEVEIDRRLKHIQVTRNINDLKSDCEEELAKCKLEHHTTKMLLKWEQDELNEAKNKLAEIQKEHEGLVTLLNRSTYNKDELKATAERLTKALDGLTRDLQDQKEESEKHIGTIKSNQIERNALQEALTQEKAGHALTRKVVAELTEELEEQVATNEALEKENTELKRRLQQATAAHSGLDSDDEEPRPELGPIGGDSTPTSFSDLAQGNFGNIVRPGIPTAQDIRDNVNEINALLGGPIANLTRAFLAIPTGTTLTIAESAAPADVIPDRVPALTTALTTPAVAEELPRSGSELARLRTLTPAQLEQVRNLFNFVQTLYHGQQDGSPVQVQRPDRSHVVIIGKTNITLDIGEIVRALSIRGKAKTETTSENLTLDVNEAGRALGSVAENTVPLAIDLGQATPIDLVQIAGGRSSRVLLTAAHEIMNGLAREAQLAPPGTVAQLGDSSLSVFSKKAQRELNTFAERLRNIASRDVTPIIKALNTNEQSMLDGPRSLDIERLGEIFEQGNNNTTERTTRVTDQELEEQLESLAAICELLGSNVTENAPLNVFNYQGSFYVYRGPTVQLNQIIEAGKVPLKFKGNRILNISKVTGTPTTTNNTIRNLQQLTKILRRLGKL